MHPRGILPRRCFEYQYWIHLSVQSANYNISHQLRSRVQYTHAPSSVCRQQHRHIDQKELDINIISIIFLPCRTPA
jgi:hypothetical protein